MGHPVKTLDQLIHSYTEAYILLEQKFLYGQKQIIIGTGEYDVCSDTNQEAINTIYLEKLAKKLQDAIFANNSGLINNLLEEIKDCFFDAKSDEETIKINYTGLYLMIINHMIKKDEKIKKYTDDNREVLEKDPSKTSLQELHGLFEVQFPDLIGEACLYLGKRNEKDTGLY